MAFFILCDRGRS